MIEALYQALRDLGRPHEVAHAARFFKTGPGEYGHGDQFWAVKVPDQRRVAKLFAPRMCLSDMALVLDSPIHECRLTGLLILCIMFSKGDLETKASVVQLYESKFDRVNNWDLVDTSAPYITGPWYLERDRSPLVAWAKQDHLWTQRIAIMSTFAMIRAGDASTTLELADILLDHPHDLIHKALGWMLREVGNRNLQEEEAFLQGTRPGGLAPRYQTMPRTMLRYAIEKFPKDLYYQYLGSGGR